jgi:DNA-binding response OmpR family regulator
MMSLPAVRTQQNCMAAPERMRVLIVEDEKSMAGLLKKGLEEENHSVSIAFNGREALELADLYEFDAIVLDLMLPQIDGFEVARRLRQSRNDTPVLMLTARDATPDIVRGLDIGADDYLTKPFSFEVFLARLRAVARRSSGSRAGCLEVADLKLDPARHRVLRGGNEIRLSPTEFRLLEFLMRRAGRVIGRGAIIEAVWNHDQDVEDNTLDAFVRLLRSKVDRNFRQKLIHTVRGVGYTVRDDLKP